MLKLSDKSEVITYNGSEISRGPWVLVALNELFDEIHSRLIQRQIKHLFIPPSSLYYPIKAYYKALFMWVISRIVKRYEDE